MRRDPSSEYSDLHNARAEVGRKELHIHDTSTHMRGNGNCHQYGRMRDYTCSALYTVWYQHGDVHMLQLYNITSKVHVSIHLCKVSTK